MAANKDPKTSTVDGWPFTYKLPNSSDSPNRLLLLLHGHLGNEYVMWILTRSIPSSYALLAPRAPIQMGPDQYSWHAIQPQWPDLRDSYQKLTEDLLRRVDAWAREHTPDVERYDVMGFSLGAVMAYALSFLVPEKIGKVAAIAGFIPQPWQRELEDVDLNGRSYFIAHGTQDEIIPLARAQQAESLLKGKGAEVQFCSAETGHKLGANCFNGLGEYFS